MNDKPEMVPLHQLITLDEKYQCSRNLFPFVNRNLNAVGLQASATIIEPDIVRFTIVRLSHDPLSHQ